jgi:hypothetical protein
LKIDFVLADLLLKTCCQGSFVGVPSVIYATLIKLLRDGCLSLVACLERVEQLPDRKFFSDAPLGLLAIVASQPSLLRCRIRC